MAAKPPKKAETAPGPSEGDLKALERLIDAGILVTKPQNANAKPRKVMAAALTQDRRHIVLWLSNKTVEIE
jgi:hypothetical protein